MTLHVNIGGTWKEVDAPEVKIGAAWKAVDTIQVNIGGFWKDVFTAASGPEVSAVSTNVDRLRSGNTCFAGVRYFNDGNEKSSTNSGSFTQSRGAWLDSGLPEEVWVSRVINSGTLNWVDAGAARAQLSVNRTYGVKRTSAGTHTANITCSFWDAASGGNLLDTATYTLRAQFEADEDE